VAQHVAVCAQGTGVSMWDTTPPQPAAVAKLFNNNIFFQPLGNWPAAPFPMGPSVRQGVDECVRLTNNVYRPGNGVGSTLIMLGYSQGAIVVSHFIRDEVLSPSGRCHGRVNDIVGVATWGNPCRLPGFASGNQFAGWPMPTNLDGVMTGGIAGRDDLMQANVAAPSRDRRHYWGDFVNTLAGPNNRDLYADCPVGANPWTAEAGPGAIETQIYNIVQGHVGQGIFGIVLDVVRVFGTFGLGLIPIIEAIINGGLFLQAGPNAAHYTYPIQPIADFINLVASETPPRP